MSGIRILGHVLLWFGFLLGAFLAVRSVEVAEAPWSTISWPAYGAAMFVAVAGVVLLRATKTAVGVASAEASGAVEELEAILTRLQSTVDGWVSSVGEADVYDVHGMIDEALADELARFAELREAISAEFGLDSYARIMTEFALAERTLNRAWSASADGYVDEVLQCLPRAVSHLAAARERLREAAETRLEAVSGQPR